MNNNPWATAQEVFNKNARIDQKVASRLADLSEHRARDDKLAFAMASGRVYGLQQQFYDMRLRKQLHGDWRHAPVEKPW